MEAVDLNAWKQFLDYIGQLDKEWAEAREKTKANISKRLYRGHSDAEFELETTLERAGHKNISIDTYYSDFVEPASILLSNFDGKKWNLESNPDLKYRSLRGKLPSYEFLAHLRHHGFPSPLLDWTASPYVAAFFAFRGVASPKSGRVAIFAYQEHAGNGKAYSSSKPGIRTQGPWAAVHPRHFAQQSQYTICFREEDGNVILAPHSGVFMSKETPLWEQDNLIKITLPYSERNKVLRELLLMNVTPYTLFHTDDSLIETVALKILMEEN